MQNYCANCGAKLKDHATYCVSCGKPVAAGHPTYPGGYVAHYEVNVPQPVPPKHIPFSCMLAYIPGLFWLPLLTDRKSNTHRESANQGLLLTIMTVIFGFAVVRIGGYILQNGLLDINAIKNLFIGLNPENCVERIPAMLGWAAFTALIMYVPVNSMCGFFHGMGSDRPYRITIFGRMHLIRPH